MTPVNISNEQPHHYIFLNIIICWACNICPRAVEQATQAMTRENLFSWSPKKLVSNQSLHVNRLARKLKFCRSKSRYDSSQKEDNTIAHETARMRRLVCAFIVRNHQRQVFSVSIQLLYASFYHERLENKMRILIIVKYDNSARIAFCAVSSKQLQCVYRHTKSYPAGERFLYHTP